MAYTPMQKAEIEYLVRRGTAVHKRREACTDDAEREKLTAELNSIRVELNNALNAEAMYRAHLRVADEHIKAAEALHNKYCRA